jgi:hypothetical protein
MMNIHLFIMMTARPATMPNLVRASVPPALVRTTRLPQDLIEHFAGAGDFSRPQRRMDKEHEAGLAKFPGHRKPLRRTPARPIKGLLQIDFRT